MSEATRTCELCGDPIEADQAWMQPADGSPAAAHSGCVYSEEGTDPAQRDRWMPPES